MASFLEAQPVVATTNVFEPGHIHITQKTLKARESSAPKQLLIFTPDVAGEYPVILFCHGFCVPNNFYCDLLSHIASHGYIVVAPQFCIIWKWMPMFGYCEVKCAGKVADWIAQKLQSVLPENVVANLGKFVMAGHSRGGKTAFATALGYAKTRLNMRVLVGIDPVDGTNKYCRTCPWLLRDKAGSFNQNMPVMVIGTGLGPEKAGCKPACAPKGLNHDNFFFECIPPCAHFVAKEYGHMDMLDDTLEGATGKIAKCLCKNGMAKKEYMRKTVAGLVVAFLRAHLDLDTHDLDAIVDNPTLAPATLHPSVYIKSPSS